MFKNISSLQGIFQKYLRNFGNHSSSKEGIHTSLRRSDNKPPKLTSFNNNKSDSNYTNKDVLLFVANNDSYFRLLNVFAISQYAFWAFTAYNFYSMKVTKKPNEEDAKKKSWLTTLDISPYKNVAAFSCAALGLGVLGGCWFHTFRTIKHVVLRKGGKNVSIATYTPFRALRYISAPLTEVSTKTSRMAAENSYLAIKIKDRKLHYLLDGSGNFTQPMLFDKTVGINRNIS